MNIKEITLLNYRNYLKLAIQLEKSGAIFVGDNGQGKTNLVEAMYLMSFGQSHRTRKDTELIHWGKEHFYVKLLCEKKEGLFTLEMAVKEDKKRIKINGKTTGRISDLMGNLPLVMFSPEDLELIKGSSAVRRVFLNKHLSQLNQIYKNEYLNYKRILRQRNAVLKELRKQKREEAYKILDVLTAQLIRSGNLIMRFRQEEVKALSDHAEQIHSAVTQGEESLKILYEPSFRDGVLFEEAFLKKREEEIFRGMTLLGPHRDDITFFINGHDSKKFGSQGQQRTAVLSLKIAEMNRLETLFQDSPVLILDDVMSELDEKRRKYLMDVILKNQTFITTALLEEDYAVLSKKLPLFEVKEGTVVSR